MSSDFIKIVILIIIAAIFAVLIKTHLQEYAFLLILAVGCSVLVMIFKDMFPQIQKLRNIFESGGNIGAYFSVALKALGISYITGFAVNVCRDFGQTALAQTAEIAGKAAIFILSVPLVCAVLESALKFIGL